MPIVIAVLLLAVLILVWMLRMNSTLLDETSEELERWRSSHEQIRMRLNECAERELRRGVNDGLALR